METEIEKATDDVIYRIENFPMKDRIKILGQVIEYFAKHGEKRKATENPH